VPKGKIRSGALNDEGFLMTVPIRPDHPMQASPLKASPDRGRVFIALALSLLIGGVAQSGRSALAQSDAEHAHHGSHAATGPDEASTRDSANREGVEKPLQWVPGEVRRLEPQTGKLTIRHGPIPEAGMSAMTMVYEVADPAMLSGLRVGDPIQFTMGQKGSRWIVTGLRKGP
jgi:Cu(I)/Ag(I) efflux system periplasmic protein CusF